MSEIYLTIGSHSAPRNHRVDVSKAARKLVDAGATSVTITLVVVGVDYKEERELLRMDGLSLKLDRGIGKAQRRRRPALRLLGTRTSTSHTPDSSGNSPGDKTARHRSFGDYPKSF